MVPLLALAALFDAYGVWVRGNRYDVKEFPSRGAEIDLKWEDVQPSKDVFIWKDFDEQLRRAASFGPMSPAWVYDEGVPRVMTTGAVDRPGGLCAG